jgi:hypothetical protein
MPGVLTIEPSRGRLLALLYKLVPTCRAAKIVGFSVDHCLDPASFGKIGLAERVFDHHVVNLGQFALSLRGRRRLPGEEQGLQRSIAQVDQKAKN